MNQSHSKSKYQQHSARYTFVKCIGKGAYGRVFKAICTKKNTTVAIKYVKLSNCETDPNLITTCRELKINIFLSSLNNNIFTVRLIDVFFMNDFNQNDAFSMKGIFMVYEYLQTNLERVLHCQEEKLDQG